MSLILGLERAIMRSLEATIAQIFFLGWCPHYSRPIAHLACRRGAFEEGFQMSSEHGRVHLNYASTGRILHEIYKVL
jgi:hypothetical protein